MTRVLVTGGRDFPYCGYVWRALDKLHAAFSFSVVIHGAARGVDSYADAWARKHGINTIPVPAEWERLGRSAGPIRNAEMLRDHKPDLVVAFPGGRGTANMVSLAREKQVRVIVVADPDVADQAEEGL